MSMKSFTKYKVMAIILFVLIAVFFTRLLIFDFTYVVGDNMSPTVEEGSVVLISRWRYTFSKPKYGDIVAINNGKGERLFTLSRVIATEGQLVEYRNNLLYIDGELVEEDFISKIGSTTADMRQVVPPGYYFVVNDNRASKGCDSRYSEFGFVSEFDIKGKASFVFFPFNKIGFLYNKSYDNSFLTRPTPTPTPAN